MCDCSRQPPSAPARLMPTEEIRPHICFLSAEEGGCEGWVLHRRQHDVTHLRWSAETCGGKWPILWVLLMWHWMVNFAPLCLSNRASGVIGDLSPIFLIHQVPLCSCTVVHSVSYTLLHTSDSCQPHTPLQCILLSSAFSEANHCSGFLCRHPCWCLVGSAELLTVSSSRMGGNRDSKCNN